MQGKDVSIKDTYDRAARENVNEIDRQFKQTNLLLKFNNWIKSVLIAEYSKQMCEKLENILDIHRGKRDPILHVFDIGCGRGQDIKKWKLARVRYMIANDFSEECIKSYQERWRNEKEPFRLLTVNSDFTKLDLYGKIEHVYFDIVSAQLCFHYMFKTKQGLQYGLASILSNLLVGGVFIATLPDSYSILRKINEKGKKIGGYTYYGNKYFSLRFEKTTFTEIHGNQYGFYLQEAVGSKNEATGQIQYTNQWLVSLDKLDEVLKTFGVQIEYTKNFLEFYLEYRDVEKYKNLFSIMGLKFEEGQSMDPELWEIAHLYRVLVCRKVSHGKKLTQYKLDERLKASIGKEIRRSVQDNRGSDRGRSSNHSGHNNSYNRGHSNYHSSSKYQDRSRH